MLVKSIMSGRGCYGLPRPGRHKPNLIGVGTPADLVNRRFPATGPKELSCSARLSWRSPPRET